MKKKDYLMFRAWLYLLLACFIISIPLWQQVEDYGILLSISLFGLFLFLSYRFFKKSKLSRDEERAYAPPTDATILQQTKFYKRMMYIAIISCSLLEVITLFDLNELAQGNTLSVTLWTPVGFLYEKFGYWPAAISIPLIGLVLILLFLRKIRIINSI